MDNEFKFVLVPKLKEIPDKCYRCLAKDNSGFATQTEDYAQRFCPRCMGEILEFAADLMKEEEGAG